MKNLLQSPNTIKISAYLRYFDNTYISDDVKTVFFQLMDCEIFNCLHRLEDHFKQLQ